MASVSLQQLLSSSWVTRAISRIKTPSARLQQFFGMQTGGANVNSVGGHDAGWDIFDKTRTLAKGRAPGTGPATIAPQNIGHVSARIPRVHEKMFLSEERIFRTRPLGGQWGEVDSRGQRYVASQEAHMAQRFQNFREFMVARMMQGGFYIKQIGEDWIPTASSSGATYGVYFQIPGGNGGPTQGSETQNLVLNPVDANGTSITGGNIIGASWATTSTDILGDLLAINQCMEVQHGWPLRHIWLNSTTMAYVLKNTGLINLGGSANVVFNEWVPEGPASAEGIATSGFRIVLRGVPWLTWHVDDRVYDDNGTITKYFADDIAVFCPDPSNQWVEMLEGSEIVAENKMDPGSERHGFAAWTERQTQPAGFELIAVDNAIPALYIPSCFMIGDTTT